MSFTPFTTADGTLSCRDEETGELCHNRSGAYTEALKNYVEPSGLLDLAAAQGEIRLLDACYGMGYNTWVLFDQLLQSVQTPFTLSVLAIEKKPDILAFLPQVLSNPTFDNLKNEMGAWEHNIDYRTLWCKSDTKGAGSGNHKIVIDVANNRRLDIQFHVGDLRQELPRLGGDFDGVFHDPFSPQKMPELWTVDLFRHYHQLLAERQGRLLTYSAAAAVRGGLQEAGFALGKTAAVGQKQGGTLAAIALPEDASPLGELEGQYLQSRAGIPYRDPDLQTDRKAILAQREQEQNRSGRPSGSEIKKLLQS